MTKARQEQVALEATSFYHCTVRCVRRAFLCGEDRTTGRNFDHRKQWLVSRIRFLSYIYAIDVCAYAVMSNHYHVVLHVDQARADKWSDHEVAERWLQLYGGHVLVNRWRAKAELSPAELDAVFEIIQQWRERLCSLSWFMRGINETIARMANQEDNCTGRFWEGRFKSQALLDEAALLSCMAYVDLNPIRAGMENDLAESDFTSIQQRLFDYCKYKNKKNDTENTVVQRIKQQRRLKNDLDLGELPEAPLMPFDGSSHTDVHHALPFTREEYFDLVDMTGRAIRNDKRGYIPGELPTIVSRLGINPDKWLEHVQGFNRHYGICAGAGEQIRDYARRFQQCWAKGIGFSARHYLPV